MWKSFRSPSFCLLHKSQNDSKLTHNVNNVNETFTCDRAKRYLPLVTLNN